MTLSSYCTTSQITECGVLPERTVRLSSRAGGLCPFTCVLLSWGSHLATHVLRLSETGTYVQLSEDSALPGTPTLTSVTVAQQWLGTGCLFEVSALRYRGHLARAAHCVWTWNPQGSLKGCWSLVLTWPHPSACEDLVKQADGCSLLTGKSQKLSKHWYKPLSTEGKQVSERLTAAS